MLFAFKAIILFTSSCILAFCDSTLIHEMNATRAFLSILSQLNDIRSEQALLRADQILGKEEQSLIKQDLSFIKSELTRQGNILDEISKNRAQFNESGSHGRSCAVIKKSGIFQILPTNYSGEPFKVVCDAETRNGGWTILLRRLDGSVDFYRNWTEYKNGFGNLEGEFFLGLDKIHALTASQSQELLVILEDFQGEVRYETYDNFAIGDELEKYALHTLGTANGTAGDSMAMQKGQKFSTFDNDNDQYAVNCAETFKGAWWYRACYESHLTGKYNGNTPGKGLTWYSFRGHDVTMKRALMMIRPRN